MEKIITLNKKTQMKIIAENFMLQYKIETRNERTKWDKGMFFSNWESSYEEYINNAPCRTVQTTEDFKKLIKVVKTAEANLRKAIEKIN